MKDSLPSIVCFFCFFLNMNLHAFSLDLEAVSFKADVKTFNRRDKLLSEPPAEDYNFHVCSLHPFRQSSLHAGFGFLLGCLVLDRVSKASPCRLARSHSWNKLEGTRWCLCLLKQLALRNHTEPWQRGRLSSPVEICKECTHKLRCCVHSLEHVTYVFRDQTVFHILLLTLKKGRESLSLDEILCEILACIKRIRGISYMTIFEELDR